MGAEVIEMILQIVAGLALLGAVAGYELRIKELEESNDKLLRACLEDKVIVDVFTDNEEG